MNPVIAFTVIMMIWTISDFISKKTNTMLSSLFIASLIFLIGFKTNLFPEDLLTSSSLLTLGTTIVGFIIVHIGTSISLQEFKAQWKTFVIGVSAVVGIAAFLFVFGPLFETTNHVIAAIAAISGGTISIVMVQEKAIVLGLVAVAVMPVLISAFQGVIGFPLTSMILRKEAKNIQVQYRNGQLKSNEKSAIEEKTSGKLPEVFQTTAGTLFIVGVVVVVSMKLSEFTGGIINTFIIALLFGIALRATGIFKKNVLGGIDAFGLMMLGVLIIIFGPLATISVNDLIELIVPLLLSFVIGVGGAIIFSVIAGKILGYSLLMSIAIGLTSLYGFPGTMILSQEAANAVGETEEEKKIIENEILPKMIIAGFSTVTITSVFLTSILVGFMI
ncbi:hypothetical protein [Breznakia pachnodae]|uniref:Na+/glutamate symporter n=1 Tax=Breznakia pachnodae TaxID=265178 RepID=A0ABU0E8X8_9FIRM|nr:hypothetical protein [Breznakia pachnodae]MDQ0363311.1 hypothetical protein [Breznakia pachnodae]